MSPLALLGFGERLRFVGGDRSRTVAPPQHHPYHQRHLHTLAGLRGDHHRRSPTMLPHVGAGGRPRRREASATSPRLTPPRRRGHGPSRSGTPPPRCDGLDARSASPLRPGAAPGVPPTSSSPAPVPPLPVRSGWATTLAGLSASLTVAGSTRSPTRPSTSSVWSAPCPPRSHPPPRAPPVGRPSGSPGHRSARAPP